MKKITKLNRTSLSDFTLCRAELLHAEECPSELVRFDAGILHLDWCEENEEKDGRIENELCR